MVDTQLLRCAIRENTIREGDAIPILLTLCNVIDNLRAEAKPTQQQHGGKSVKVRVAVGIDVVGYWRAVGRKAADDKLICTQISDRMAGSHNIYWLTATLPVPEEREIEAEVDG